MRDSILVVRPALIDFDGVVGLVAPDVPAGWTDYQVEAGGWITYWPRGRAEHPARYVHVRCVAEGLAAGRAAFFFSGPTLILDNIASTSFRDWPGCPALRADSTTVATNVKAKWYDQDHVGYVTDRMAGYDDTAAEVRVQEDEE